MSEDHAVRIWRVLRTSVVNEIVRDPGDGLRIESIGPGPREGEMFFTVGFADGVRVKVTLEKASP